MFSEIIANPVSGKNTVTLQDANRLPMKGGTEIKFDVTAKVISGEQEKTVRLVEREMRDVDAWIERWERMRLAGLPVPPTVRRTEQGSLLVTNVKHDGSETYGRSSNFDSDHREATGQGYTPNALDEHFIRIMENQRNEIEAQALHYAAMATEHGITLPFDDPFEVLVKPDGSWSLVILDLRFVYLDELPADQLHTKNTQHVATFMRAIDRYCAYLQSKMAQKNPTV
jgi:hypothetical protein